MERPGYNSSEQLRVRTCPCGCLFDLETAKSHSLYDHSRPKLCFACQRSDVSKGKDEKPYDFEVRSILLSGSV